MIHDEATSSNEAHAKFKKVQQGVENEGYYFSKKERKKSRLTHQSLYFNFKLEQILCFISNSICTLKNFEQKIFWICNCCDKDNDPTEFPKHSLENWVDLPPVAIEYLLLEQGPIGA